MTTVITGNRVMVTPPARPKKLTGTRFATVLGLNKWSTEFEVWCEITKTYQKPFEDTIYTIAGKTIEPKQADYCEKWCFMNLTRPSDIWGQDYFKKTWGDFFPEVEVFGGMWDYLQTDGFGNPIGVLEMKTTKRAEDWVDDIPEYYALQAALYAYLLGLDQVTMVCSFLQPDDYDHPEEYVPSMDNTICKTFLVSERYPNFRSDYIEPAYQWYQDYVKTGISPQFTDKDADIIRELRTVSVPVEKDMEAILTEAENLEKKIYLHDKEIDMDRKRLKTLKDHIKTYLTEKITDGMSYATTTSGKREWRVTKSPKITVDTQSLISDGLTTYFKTTDLYKLTTKEI